MTALREVADLEILQSRHAISLAAHQQ